MAFVLVTLQRALQLLTSINSSFVYCWPQVATKSPLFNCLSLVSQSEKSPSVGLGCKGTFRFRNQCLIFNLLCTQSILLHIVYFETQLLLSYNYKIQIGKNGMCIRDCSQCHIWGLLQITPFQKRKYASQIVWLQGCNSVRGLGLIFTRSQVQASGPQTKPCV